jgi:16S rRNA (guanine(1405)-N(7))-methyltransferase
MSERAEQALGELMGSKKYKQICKDTVRRIFLQELAKRGNVKQADKAARAQLHQISGAYMGEDGRKRADALLKEYQAGDETAFDRLMALHASTKERAPYAQALYGALFERIGKPRRVLDLACGLNPLMLARQGVSVEGVDIHGGMIELVNQWAQALSLPVQTWVGDLLCMEKFPEADAVLMLKLLPVLEQQRSGAAMALLLAQHAKWRVVSFPTRSLGGRRVGMERHYTEWFEGNLPQTLQIWDRFCVDNELFYIVKKAQNE